MSSSGAAISVRGLSKSFIISHDLTKATTMAEAVVHKIRNPFKNVQTEEFWAVRDVSFEVQEGEVVGILGRNGAGKSTLLKVLSRITMPTAGEVRLRGRVGSLLEVGTGFHQELTGRENIYLNGAILGMRKKEIDRQFDAIVEFAGTEQFLDTPVKRYSSGMYVRLAFAVAAHLDLEIMIVDEVLAVGDIEFQKKCLGKMSEVANQGRTVLFVSHNMAALRGLCSRGLLMRQGCLALDADIESAVAENLRVDKVSEGLVEWGPTEAACPEMRFTKAYILDKDDAPTSTVDTAEPFKIVVEYEVLKPTPGIRLGMSLQNNLGILITGSNEPEFWTNSKGTPGTYRSVIEFPGYILNEGQYMVAFTTDQMPYSQVLAGTDYSLQFFTLETLGNGPERTKLKGLLRPNLSWRVAEVKK